MDPLIVSLALAFQAAAQFIAQKLIEKGLIEPSVAPILDTMQARGEGSGGRPSAGAGNHRRDSRRCPAEEANHKR